MRAIRLLLMMVGVTITCILNAQEVNDKQNEEKLSKGIKIGSRNYSRTKTGFFAPSDMSLGIAYDYETLNFSYDDISNKALNGGRICYVIHGPLSKKGIISIECPFSFWFNYVKDTNVGHGYESIKRLDGGGTLLGILLSTGYCFKEKYYVTIGCGALLNLSIEESTLEPRNGKKTKISNIGYRNKLLKDFDVPISFSASFRYKRLGLRLNYDIGTINRYKKDYYKKMGVPENYTKKNNHLCIGIQYYFM